MFDDITAQNVPNMEQDTLTNSRPTKYGKDKCDGNNTESNYKKSKTIRKS